jgi:hypothetical protein
MIRYDQPNFLVYWNNQVVRGKQVHYCHDQADLKKLKSVLMDPTACKGSKVCCMFIVVELFVDLTNMTKW